MSQVQLIPYPACSFLEFFLRPSFMLCFHPATVCSIRQLLLSLSLRLPICMHAVLARPQPGKTRNRKQNRAAKGNASLMSRCCIALPDFLARLHLRLCELPCLASSTLLDLNCAYVAALQLRTPGVPALLFLKPRIELPAKRVLVQMLWHFVRTVRRSRRPPSVRGAADLFLRVGVCISSFSP